MLRTILSQHLKAFPFLRNKQTWKQLSSSKRPNKDYKTFGNCSEFKSSTIILPFPDFVKRQVG